MDELYYQSTSDISINFNIEDEDGGSDETDETVTVETPPQPQKIQIPNVVRETFIDFTVAYLMQAERPKNIDKFALQFFHKKGEGLGMSIQDQDEIARRKLQRDGFIAFPSTMLNAEEDDDDEDEDIPPNEKFVPDKKFEDWVTKFTIAYLCKTPEPDSIEDFGVQYCRKLVPLGPRDMVAMM